MFKLPIFDNKISYHRFSASNKKDTEYEDFFFLIKLFLDNPHHKRS